MTTLQFSSREEKSPSPSAVCSLPRGGKTLEHLQASRLQKSMACLASQSQLMAQNTWGRHTVKLETQAEREMHQDCARLINTSSFCGTPPSSKAPWSMHRRLWAGPASQPTRVSNCRLILSRVQLFERERHIIQVARWFIIVWINCRDGIEPKKTNNAKHFCPLIFILSPLKNTNNFSSRPWIIYESKTHQLLQGRNGRQAALIFSYGHRVGYFLFCSFLSFCLSILEFHSGSDLSSITHLRFSK